MFPSSSDLVDLVCGVVLLLILFGPALLIRYLDRARPAAPARAAAKERP
jgi:hypothetical protein